MLWFGPCCSPTRTPFEKPSGFCSRLRTWISSSSAYWRARRKYADFAHWLLANQTPASHGSDQERCVMNAHQDVTGTLDHRLMRGLDDLAAGENSEDQQRLSVAACHSARADAFHVRAVPVGDHQIAEVSLFDRGESLEPSRGPHVDGGQPSLNCCAPEVFVLVDFRRRYGLAGLFGEGHGLPPGTPIPVPGAIVLCGSTLPRYVHYANRSSLKEQRSIASDASGGHVILSAPRLSHSCLVTFAQSRMSPAGFAVDSFDSATRFVTRLARATKGPPRRRRPELKGVSGC